MLLASFEHDDINVAMKGIVRQRSNLVNTVPVVVQLIGVYADIASFGI